MVDFFHMRPTPIRRALGELIVARVAWAFVGIATMIVKINHSLMSSTGLTTAGLSARTGEGVDQFFVAVQVKAVTMG